MFHILCLFLSNDLTRRPPSPWKVTSTRPCACFLPLSIHFSLPSEVGSLIVMKMMLWSDIVQAGDDPLRSRISWRGVGESRDTSPTWAWPTEETLMEMLPHAYVEEERTTWGGTERPTFSSPFPASSSEQQRKNVSSEDEDNNGFSRPGMESQEVTFTVVGHREQ